MVYETLPVRTSWTGFFIYDDYNVPLKMKRLLLILIVLTNSSVTQTKNILINDNTPHLKKQNTTTQLIINGKPFLILGGELGNSSFTSLEYMEPAWSKLKMMNLNTVLAPIYWELIEPEEGKFDFTLYDQLIDEIAKK